MEMAESEPETVEVIKALLTYKKNSPGSSSLLDGDSVDKAIKVTADKKMALLSAVLMESAKDKAGAAPDVFEF